MTVHRRGSVGVPRVRVSNPVLIAAIAIAVAVGSRVAFAQCPAFGTPNTYSLATTPGALVIADLNGDGKPDLVVGDYLNISVFLGKGDGTFMSAITTADQGLYGMAVADLNGDGKADIVTAEGNPGTVGVYLGNGDGTFQTRVQYVIPFQMSGDVTQAVAVGDFNGDGKLDLAVTDSAANEVWIFLGNGDGTFKTTAPQPVGYATDTYPTVVITGDFNGDGLLDLAISNHDSNANDISILLGNGDGTFQAAKNTTMPASASPAFTLPGPLAAADFNGDGKLDLVVGSSANGVLAILPGNGDGTFGTATTIATGAGTATSVIVTDFDGDGNLDVAVLEKSPAPFWIFGGKGDGTFGSPVQPGGPNFPAGGAAADLDGNGRPDLVWTTSYQVNSVSAMLNTCPIPDLTIAKSHSGSFPRGATGSWTITVSNLGPVASTGKVTVTDTLPAGAGLTVASMSGSGWTCNSGTISCVRSDALAAGASYPAITIAVNLTTSQSTLLNTAHVSGGGDASPSNDTATDTATVTEVPDLTITKTHAATFTQGDAADNYTITVGNSGTAVTTGTVTVTDTPQSGLTLTGLTGSGWTCTPGASSCTRSDALAVGASYPAITATVSVAPNAASTVTNSATVSGGGEAKTSNDTANDATPIASLPDLTVTKSHAGNFVQGQTGTYTIRVTNIGGAPASGAVSMTDTLPAGMTLSTIGGTGWSCGGTLTCTRSDALAAGTSYPDISLVVNIAANASTGTNSVTVSGGGEVFTSDDTATDPTTVLVLTDLSPTIARSGTFRQGDKGDTYTIVVRNLGGVASSGTVTLNDALPSGLTPTLITGKGWSCTLATLTCTRADALGALASYPPITLTVNVGLTAPTTSIVDTATVSGGGDTNASNNAASDTTTIAPAVSSCAVFPSANNYGVGSPVKVAAADLNGDGRSDLVIVNEAMASYVTILLGTASGFAPPVNYPVGVEPTGVVIGDFDGDGKLDLAVTNAFGADVIFVLFGRGDGTFTPGIAAYTNALETHNGPFVAGDFNGDGRLDLAILDQSSSGSVEILLGNGNGTFSRGNTYVPGSTPTGIAARDFNGDGKLDLAIANSGSDNVSIFLGNGDGTFAAAVNYATGMLPVKLTVADFDGDGKLDLAVLNANSANVSILRGNGDGTFAAAVNYPTFTVESDIAATDLNGDGKPDVVLGGGANVAVLLNNGNATFGAITRYTNGINADSIAVADFDGDGKSDVAACDFINEAVIEHRGNGDGTFAAAAGVIGFGTVSGGAVGDFNGDGKLDVVTVYPNTQTVSMRLGNGDGTLGTENGMSVGAAPVAAAAGDFNGDGKLDLAIADKGSNSVEILLGNGSGTFAAPASYAASGSPTVIAVGDFDGDGRLDVVTANGSSNNLSVLIGNGNGTFKTAVNYATGTAPSAIGVGDFNGDGIPDIAVANKTGNSISILLGVGDGTFAAAASYPTGAAPTSLTLADLNGDGRLDLITTSSQANTISILMGIGDGTFAPVRTQSIGFGTGMAAVHDLNGDGNADIAVANFNGFYVLTGNGDGTFSAPTEFFTGAPTQFLFAGDFNGDGQTDLAGGAPEGTTAVYLNQCPPILRAMMSHTGDFVQTGTGTYSIVVSNVGAMATSTAIRVTETLPTGLTLAAISGTGWACSLAASSCSRTDPLAVGASYPPITVTVNVAANAPTSVTNTATASGGDIAQLTSFAGDPTTILTSDLTITKTHSGTFAQGNSGKTYTITVSNAGPAPTNTAVTVTDTLPSSLAATAISGTGWTCTLATVSCTRSDVLAAGASYPPIVVTVSVSNRAPASVTNMATVSGGGEVNTSNDTASDVTAIAVTFPPGDMNGDGTVSAADIFYLVKYLFVAGPAPVASPDINGDGVVNVADVFYLINSLFAGGPAPK